MEKRVTSETGGQKGQKPARHDLIPSHFINGIALVFGFGSEKYDDDNWRKGYSWRLSYGALQRHLHAFWTGESYDKESGLHHLLHAAWHCAVLYTFSTIEKYSRFDDRPDAGGDVSTGLCAPSWRSRPPAGTGHVGTPIKKVDVETGLEIVRTEEIHGHTVEFFADEKTGYIDGEYYRGTDFTSRVRLYRAGYNTVDEEIEDLGRLTRDNLARVRSQELKGEPA